MPKLLHLYSCSKMSSTEITWFYETSVAISVALVISGSSFHIYNKPYCSKSKKPLRLLGLLTPQAFTLTV